MFLHLRLIVTLAATSAAAQMALAGDNKPEQNEENKIICKREIATGSIMQRRTCHTKKQWDELGSKSKSDLENITKNERSRSMVEGNR